ncbi:MAG: hypothetical protein ACXIT9_08150 [Nitritalea sp.]
MPPIGFGFRMHWRRWWRAEGRHSLQSPLLLQLYDALEQAPQLSLEQVCETLLPAYPLHILSEQKDIPPQLPPSVTGSLWLVKGLYRQPRRFQQWQHLSKQPLLALEIRGEGLLLVGSAFSAGHYIFDL